MDSRISMESYLNLSLAAAFACIHKVFESIRAKKNLQPTFETILGGRRGSFSYK
jgi:hypothetical protein